MEITTYTYSKFVGWLGVIPMGSLILFILYKSITDPRLGMWPMIIVILMAGSGMAYGIIRVLKPAYRGDVAIEVDNEKIQSNITKTTIYWKDVFEVSEYYSGNYYTAVYIGMIDGSGPYKIPTKTIAGSTKDICATMQEYFEKTKLK